MSSNHDREHHGLDGEDAALARAWRQASDERPSAPLDAAILAAARRSAREDEPGARAIPVRARARSRWMQWQPLAAAATVAGLALVLLQTLPREREVMPPVRIQAPESTSLGEAEVVPPTRRDAPPPAPAPAEAAADVADVADAMQRAETDQRKGMMTDAARDAFSQEAAAPAADRSVIRAKGTAAAPGALDWAARIEALHASGDLAGAAAALREFRSVDPEADARLPESLQEWARTVTR